jgi:hypothetical protein
MQNFSNIEEIKTLQAERASKRLADMIDMGERVSKMLGDFNLLPIIINRPGNYLTRDGRLVTIFSVSEKTGCNGRIWKEFRGKMAPRTHRSWDMNGRRSFLEIMGSDIISTA